MEEVDPDAAGVVEVVGETPGNQTGYGAYFNVTAQLCMDFALPLYGYMMPILLVVTVISNTLIILVLSKRHMRTPTNIVLMTMALADLFTMIFPAPWLFYLYTLGNYVRPISPTSACYAYAIMMEILPNLFHTASIWLTLALALQRYIYVCHPTTARTWCTIPRVLWAIFSIFLLSVLHQGTNALSRNFVSAPHREGCLVTEAYWVEFLTPEVYYSVYYWFRVAFVHTLPCLFLVILNVLLFSALKKAERKRKNLLKDNRKNESRKMRDSQSTTCMLIVVVSVFLVVEIPLAVLTFLHILQSVYTSVLIVEYEVANCLILFSNFFIAVSYPINFAIYCGMSRQFRETFSDLFMRRDASEIVDTTTTMVNGTRTNLESNETVL
ncbi:unnamed protein product [Darwinula stevensoni]|uniref:G-protein coupled receptors family 1 profile domain-containing protein n=1 Tax=Darwinula stevensoni TaxID=69355 RepID=A0A7R9FTK3_9CRUS|nr:unnamed protein product [Darwinula stevensoni]CAG0904877.1 unnamed protein product [Darwinula stevensoni]